MTNPRRTIGYISDDLRLIADQMDEIINTLDSEELLCDSDWRWGLKVTLRDDADFLVGEIRPEPAGNYLAFFPYAIDTKDNA